MFTANEIVETLTSLEVSHVVWLPDSLIGTWEDALEASSQLDLVRVCREGEAWSLAAGLKLGGKSPMVMIQTTGLFESGDSMRNVLFDLRLPLYAIVGGRSFLSTRSSDSARVFAEPILRAWGIDCCLIDQPSRKPLLAQHVLQCAESAKPGIALVAEEGL